MESNLILNGENFNKIKEEIKKNKGKKIIFSGNNDELNKMILEKENIDILLLNQSNRRDFLKQRNSGFNQVLAKLAKKNNVAVGINLDEIINSPGSKKSEILARISQNIKLCNKNKVRMKFVFAEKKSNRDIHDLKSLGVVLGMPTWMTKSLK